MENTPPVPPTALGRSRPGPTQPEIPRIEGGKASGPPHSQTLGPSDRVTGTLPRQNNLRFPTTRWTVVQRAVSAQPSEAEEALEWLYCAYWQPLFSAVLRMGFQFHEAEDLTQGFLLKLMQNESWASADACKGSLRSYLRTGLRRFVFDELGRRKRRPLDFRQEVPEEVPDGEPAAQFDRDWALQVFHRAQRSLTEQLSRSEDYSILEALLRRIFSGEAAPHSEVAASLGLTEEAVKMRTVRLRKQWQRVLRDEVAKTVVSPAEIDAELRHLVAVLSRG